MEVRYSGGRVVINVDGPDLANDIYVDNAGNLFICGGNQANDMFAIKLTANGQIEKKFGEGGLKCVAYDGNASATSMTILNDTLYLVGSVPYTDISSQYITTPTVAAVNATTGSTLWQNQIQPPKNGLYSQENVGFDIYVYERPDTSRSNGVFVELISSSYITGRVVNDYNLNQRWQEYSPSNFMYGFWAYDSIQESKSWNGFGDDNKYRSDHFLAAGSYATNSSSDFALSGIVNDSVFNYKEDLIESMSKSSLRVVTDLGGYDIATTLLADSDHYYAAGTSSGSPAIVKYDLWGNLAAGFGNNGKVVTAVGGYAVINESLLQADGKIVLVGGMDQHFLMLRYNPDGTLDSSFGRGGIVTTDFGYGLSCTAFDVVQIDSGYTLVGIADGDIALAKYDSVGNLATSFLTGGPVEAHEIIGTSAPDLLTAPTNSCSIDGLSGVDVLQLGGNSADTSISVTAAATTLTSKISGNTIALHGVERLAFSNKKIALDIDGNAGKVVKTLATVFGAASVSNKQFVGIALELLDGGTSFDDLNALAIRSALEVQGLALTRENVVHLLWTNLMGHAPTQPQAQPFVDMLATDLGNLGALGVIASEFAATIGLVNLTGLSLTGLDYI